MVPLAKKAGRFIGRTKYRNGRSIPPFDVPFRSGPVPLGPASCFISTSYVTYEKAGLTLSREVSLSRKKHELIRKLRRDTVRLALRSEVMTNRATPRATAAVYKVPSDSPADSTRADTRRHSTINDLHSRGRFIIAISETTTAETRRDTGSQRR